jgi:hypothetical protein
MMWMKEITLKELDQKTNSGEWETLSRLVDDSDRVIFEMKKVVSNQRFIVEIVKKNDQSADDRVADYISRAVNIYDRSFYRAESPTEREVVIGIAQMLQREES